MGFNMPKLNLYSENESLSLGYLWINYPETVA